MDPYGPVCHSECTNGTSHDSHDACYDSHVLGLKWNQIELFFRLAASQPQ